MKRVIVIGLAGAFGALMLIPIAHGRDWRDRYNDENAIRQEQQELMSRQMEQQKDIENGRFGAAAREQEKIEQRRAQIRVQRRDLNRDWGNIYRDYDDEAEYYEANFSY